MTTQSTLSSSMCVEAVAGLAGDRDLWGLDLCHIVELAARHWHSLRVASRSGRVNSMSSSMHFAVCLSAQSYPSPSISGAISAYDHLNAKS